MTSLERNADLFVRFRVLFNARFYYPVLAVFFVDLGLSLDQYALLNVAWAASIVAFELPLGALGDQIGRRPLIIAAAAIMVIEMAVLGFFPTGNAELLFGVLLANRVLSGLAEAAASGADEALAYDSLVCLDRENEWPKVLSRLSFAMSFAFVGAMLVGAAVYDPNVVQRVASAVGLDVTVTQATTVRFPVYLTFLLSLGALVTSLRMTEPPDAERDAAEPTTLRSSVAAVLRAGAFIARSPYVLSIMGFAIALDIFVRVFLTIASSYYRLVGIPEVLFGPLGAAFAALGVFTPALATRLIARASPLVGFLAIAGLMIGGLTGIALWLHPAAVLLFLPVGLGMHLSGFLVSTYLNAATPSKQRATVLSFKSLAGNLGYGLAGWGFALLLRGLAGGVAPPAGSAAEGRVLADALTAFPAAIALAAGVVALGAAWVSRMRSAQPPGAPGPEAGQVE